MEISRGAHHEVSEPCQNWQGWDSFTVTVIVIVGLHIQVDAVRLGARSICVSIPKDHTIIIELDPFGGVVESMASWDMEMGNASIVEDVPLWSMLKGLLVVEDPVLKAFNLIRKVMVVDGSLGLTLGNHAKEFIGNCAEEDGIDVWIVLKCGIDCLGQHCQWYWHIRLWDWKWCQRFGWGDV